MSATQTEPASYQVALAFEDGVTRFITCQAGQTVADASYRQRINIPLDCRDGACGTCKARCESGSFEPGNYLDDALSGDEADAGFVLPCSMRPLSDLVLQIASTSEVAKTRATTYASTIVGLDWLSATTVELAVEIPNRDELGFLPGQYVNIAVPGTESSPDGALVSRSYSFSNPPSDDVLTFLIKITPGGAMSTYLTERAQIGDDLAFTGPNGSFFLREADRPVVLLAGGTGLAPVLSILAKLRADGSSRPVRLIYGASTDDDVIKLRELEVIAKAMPNLSWDYCVAEPNTTAANQGYVTGLLEPRDLNDGDVAIYLCGPPPMVEAVRRHLADTGLEPTGFYYEKFALAVPADSEAASDPQSVAELTTVAGSEPVATVVAEELIFNPTAYSIAGQPIAPTHELAAWPQAAGATPPGDLLRRIAGQLIAPVDLAEESEGSPAEASAAHRSVTKSSTPTADAVLGDGPDLPIIAEAARDIAGQSIFPRTDLEQLVFVPAPKIRSPYSTPGPSAVAGAAQPGTTQPRTTQPRTTQPGRNLSEPPVRHTISAGPTTTPDGYVIGEEHPDIQASDSVFEARQALELGALELTIGRMDTRQLAGYRLLAELTLPHVDVAAERFTDAAAYTETNAAFHDYLFSQTGNEHLLQAYQALGVKGQMSEVLANATWCHPRCAQDHIEIVEAFESGNREAARALIVAHANRSKQTMRRAMEDQARRVRPRFVTPGRFAGQVVVVTGAAQGIGAQVARRIGAEGGTLILADRSDLVGELATELSRDDITAIPVICDLESYSGAATFAAQASAQLGRIDILINNVGGAINFKPFTEFTDTEIAAEINRSLMTTLYACRAALPAMVAAGRGTIVNVSSAATRGIHRIPYSAAKGGINAITTSLALEYADAGIRVVATAPGGTEAPPRRISRGTPEPRTDEERAWFQAHIDQTLDHSLMHRYGTLDEQAAAICFLASDEASYITGTVLPVAGGDPG